MPSNIGADGTVRLRAYLAIESVTYLAGCCPTCHRSVTIGIEAAIALLGSADATVGALEGRLLCQPCGRRVLLVVVADTRSAETQRREGRLPATLGLSVQA